MCLAFFREPDQWIFFIIIDAMSGMKENKKKKLLQKLLKLRKIFLMKIFCGWEPKRSFVHWLFTFVTWCKFSVFLLHSSSHKLLHQLARIPISFRIYFLGFSFSKHSIIWIPKNLWEFQQAARHSRTRGELETRGERKMKINNNKKFSLAFC